jgi:hypothetical protein
VSTIPKRKSKLFYSLSKRIWLTKSEDMSQPSSIISTEIGKGQKKKLCKGSTRGAGQLFRRLLKCAIGFQENQVTIMCVTFFRQKVWRLEEG